jgi:hypothetical protein
MIILDLDYSMTADVAEHGVNHEIAILDNGNKSSSEKLLKLADLQLRKNADAESIELNLREKTGKQVLW